MKDKTTAGILAIFLGAYGAHWFYLGQKDKAIKYLLITLLTFGIGAIVMEILSIIDGIHFLGMTDDAFRSYVESKDNEKSDTAQKADVSAVSKFEDLKQAKELLDSGVISEEEFTSMKNKILGE